MFKFLIYFIIIVTFIVGCGSSEDSKDSLKNKTDFLISKSTLDKPTYNSFVYDPLFKYQWHLLNKNGIDLNVVDVWERYQGYGVNVSVVDTGIEVGHPDLENRVDLVRSFRYSDLSNDPTPTKQQLNNPLLDTPHGTAIAGIIAADHNSIGVSGIAPQVSLVGLNVFSNPEDSSFESAMLYKNVDVSSNSWGSSLDSGLDDDRVVLDAIVEKMNTDPTIFVFAAGNESSNTNFSSVLSSRYTIVVGAIDNYGKVANYSNFGANLTIVAPAGGDNYNSKKIVTTDLSGKIYGYDSVEKSHFRKKGNENYSYTDAMNGTSASVPMVSAVIALMLEANRDLSYRDIKYILAHTSKKIDKNHFSWKRNGAGIFVSEYYGFGLIDAKAAVNMAEIFTPLPKEKSIEVSKSDFNINIEDNDKRGIDIVFDIDEDIIVEYVEVSIKTDHTYSGDLKITLASAQNTKSTLAYGKTDMSDNYSPWTFSTIEPYEEHSRGKWRLNIADIYRTHTGTLNEVKLTIYGHEK